MEQKSPRKVALLANCLLNQNAKVRAALPDMLGLLEAGGYGLLQLPPPGEHRLLLAVIADQIAEYAHHGYAVVAIGLRGELAALLARHDLPAEEQQRWRV